MMEGAATFGYLVAINMYPMLAAVLNPLLAKAAASPMRNQKNMVVPIVRERLQMGDRSDLINPLIQRSGMEDLLANAQVLIGAGAETTTGILMAVTTLLIDNPDKLAKLADEVRGAFSSEKLITGEAVSRLPYLLACIDEALRLCPQTGAPSMRMTDKQTTICGPPSPESRFRKM